MKSTRKKKWEFHQFSLIAPMTTIQCYKLSTNQMIVENFEYQPPSGSHHDTTATPVIFPSLSTLTTPLLKEKKLLLSTVQDDAQKRKKNVYETSAAFKIIDFPSSSLRPYFLLFFLASHTIVFSFFHSFIFTIWKNPPRSWRGVHIWSGSFYSN